MLYGSPSNAIEVKSWLTVAGRFDSKDNNMTFINITEGNMLHEVCRSNQVGVRRCPHHLGAEDDQIPFTTSFQ